MSVFYLRHDIHISHRQMHSPAKELQDSCFFGLAMMNALNIKFFHSSFTFSYVTYILTYLVTYITYFPYLLTFCLTLNTWPNDHGLIHKLDMFLVAYAILQKATIGFIISVCSSVCLHGITHLPLDRFSWNLIPPPKKKSLEKIQVEDWSLSGILGTLLEDICTIMIVSHQVLLRMRNVSDNSCRENQTTHFMFNKCCPKS
jgi:hypothetical protein